MKYLNLLLIALTGFVFSCQEEPMGPDPPGKLEVQTINPEDGAIKVNCSTAVDIIFDAESDQLSRIDIALTYGSVSVAGFKSVVSKRQISFKPMNPLPPETRITVRLDGEILNKTYLSSFTTCKDEPEFIPLQIESVSPPVGEIGLDVDKIIIDANQALDRNSVISGLSFQNSDGIALQTPVQIYGDKAYVDVEGKLEPGRAYKLVLSDNISAADDNTNKLNVQKEYSYNVSLFSDPNPFSVPTGWQILAGTSSDDRIYAAGTKFLRPNGIDVGFYAEFDLQGKLIRFQELIIDSKHTNVVKIAVDNQYIYLAILLDSELRGVGGEVWIQVRDKETSEVISQVRYGDTKGDIRNMKSFGDNIYLHYFMHNISYLHLINKSGTVNSKIIPGAKDFLFSEGFLYVSSTINEGNVGQYGIDSSMVGIGLAKYSADLSDKIWFKKYSEDNMNYAFGKLVIVDNKLYVLGELSNMQIGFYQHIMLSYDYGGVLNSKFELPLEIKGFLDVSTDGISIYKTSNFVRIDTDGSSYIYHEDQDTGSYNLFYNKNLNLFFIITFKNKFNVFGPNGQRML